MVLMKLQKTWNLNCLSRSCFVEVQNVGINIFLNIEPTLFGFFIKYNELYKNAESLIRNLKIDLPSVKVNVSELSGGQRQGVAIAEPWHVGKVFLY